MLISSMASFSRTRQSSAAARFIGVSNLNAAMVFVDVLIWSEVTENDDLRMSVGCDDAFLPTDLRSVSWQAFSKSVAPQRSFISCSLELGAGFAGAGVGWL